MKVLQKQRVLEGGQLEHTRAEKSVLQRMVGNPFVVNLHYAFQSSRELYLVLDFMQGGELFYHLRQAADGRFPEAVALAVGVKVI